MKNLISVLLIWLFSAAVVLSIADNSQALGLGAYLDYASGSGTFEQAERGDVDVTQTGFGFVLDSNVSKDKLFNYRLHVGYYELDIDQLSDVDAYAINIENAFGFTLTKTDKFRLWLGPELHLGYANWDISQSYWDIYGTDIYSYGVGVVLGANINLPGVMSLCPELGVRYQYNESDTTSNTYLYYNGTDYEYRTVVTDYSYDETVIFVRLSFLFRIHE